MTAPQKVSQTEQILKHLKSGRSISAAVAVHDYGIFRLAARIDDLKRKGHKISTEMRTSPGGKRFAVYSLKK